MSKFRTTVYLSRGARIVAGDLIRSRRFSQFVEEAIYKEKGITGYAGPDELDKIIRELQAEIVQAQELKDNMLENTKQLNKFADFIIDKCIANDWNIQRAFRVYPNHLSDEPMVSMSKSELQHYIENRMRE